MNVLFDYQIFYLQQYGGISRYFSRLIETLARRDGMHLALPLRWSTNQEAARLRALFGDIGRQPPFPESLRLGPGARKVRSLFYMASPRHDPSRQHQRDLMEELRRHSYDVFHPTYYEDYYLAERDRPPVVLTAFDMLQERFPEFYKGWRVRALLEKKRAVMRAASHLIAISHSTRNDLCRIYGIPESKVTVIHLANSLSMEGAADPSSAGMALPERFLLFVGSRFGYKNFRFFLSSIAPLMHSDAGLNVVCTGAGFTAGEVKEIHALGLAGRVTCVQAASDQTLAFLYMHAIAFVFPSLYEGFGLPVLEAMHCGCPVIVSKTSSFPEVAGEAAAYIDPSDALSIREAVGRVLGSPSLRQEMIEQGRLQERKFSYEKAADETLAVYRSVAR